MVKSGDAAGKDTAVAVTHGADQHAASAQGTPLSTPAPDGAAVDGPLEMAQMAVLPDRIDYNGHMKESR